MCASCNHHRARHNQPTASSASPTSPFVPLKRSTPPPQPVSPTTSSTVIPIAPALTNPKKKQHKLTEQFKSKQQQHFVYVHQLGYGQLVSSDSDSAGGAEAAGGDGMVAVKLNGSGATVWLPRSHVTDTLWVHIRSFHNFQPKNAPPSSIPTAPAMSSTASPTSPATPAPVPATATPAIPPSTTTTTQSATVSVLSSLTVEVDLNSSVLVGLVHVLMDVYAQYGVELEEEEVRLIANGRELTSASSTLTASTLLADCPQLVPFSTLLLVYDPQSSFTLDPLSSTSPVSHPRF